MLGQITHRTLKVQLRSFCSSNPLRTERLRSLASFSKSELSHFNEIIKEASICNWENEDPYEIMDSVSAKIKSDVSLSPQEKIQFHNGVLENLLIKDQTLVSYHTREISSLKGKLTPNALKEVITHNSGRVLSSWELFEKHIENLTIPYSSDIESFNEIVKLVIDKQLNGEIVDQGSQEPFEPSRDDILKAVFLKNIIGESGEGFLKPLLESSLKANDYKAIEALGTQEKDLEKIQNDSDYLKLVSVIGVKNIDKAQIHELLIKTTDPNIAVEGIEVVNKVGKETVKKFKELNSRFKTLKIPINEETIKVNKDAIFEKILGKSEKLINDKSSYDPRVRASLLKVYGINKNELHKALKLYDDFSLTDGKNVDVYMTAMVEVLSYHAVQSSNNSFLKIAESLLHNPIPIPALQSLILANSEFDLNKSLDLYNNYISTVSREHKSDVSQATKLTESLLIAYLSKRNREFANLIHDGAVTNEVVTGKAAIKKLKDCFRKYGVIVAEEEGSIDSLLKQSVLEAIKKLPVV